MQTNLILHMVVLLLRTADQQSFSISLTLDRVSRLEKFSEHPNGIARELLRIRSPEHFPGLTGQDQDSLTCNLEDRHSMVAPCYARLPTKLIDLNSYSHFYHR